MYLPLFKNRYQSQYPDQVRVLTIIAGIRLIPIPVLVESYSLLFIILKQLLFCSDFDMFYIITESWAIRVHWAAILSMTATTSSPRCHWTRPRKATAQESLAQPIEYWSTSPCVIIIFLAADQIQMKLPLLPRHFTADRPSSLPATVPTPAAAAHCPLTLP